jgi:hypothetical protein
MNKTISFILTVVILGALVLFFVKSKPATAPIEEVPTATSTPVTATSTPATTTAPLINVSLPKENSVITSPVSVEGTARGNWFFEASAPVYVTDANGKKLGQSHIQATGEWMTTDFVPFKGSVTFTAPTTTTGFIVFENDNPSGDPERQLTFKVPVKFK